MFPCKSRMMIFISYALILLFTLYTTCESLKCYECSGHISCGQGQTDLMVQCSGKCMVYRNQYDGGMIVRRCCTNDCGTEDGLRDYEGRVPAYFCSQDLCNDILSDGNLPGGPIDPLSTTTNSVLLTTNDVSSTTKSCYECTSHYSQCGIDESTVIHGCKACMVYLNVFDGNTIVRRCCTSGCGSSGSIGDYEGRTAYFCSSNRCNGIGTEAVLPGGITLSPIPTGVTSLSSTSSTPCILNCQHGSTPETENGCFCHCFEKTNGRECENIDCIQPDDTDADLCLPENQSLCDQSDIFAYKCLHLCAKC